MIALIIWEEIDAAKIMKANNTISNVTNDLYKNEFYENEKTDNLTNWI